MRDVKPWVVRHSGSHSLEVSEDGIFLFAVGWCGPSISEEKLHTLLHAPVYEALLLELVDKGTTIRDDDLIEVNAMVVVDLIIRARAALKEE